MKTWTRLLLILVEISYRLRSMNRPNHNTVMSEEWRMRKELHPNEYD